MNITDKTVNAIALELGLTNAQVEIALSRLYIRDSFFFDSIQELDSVVKAIQTVHFS